MCEPLYKGSNNTNKLSPQEHEDYEEIMKLRSNNTNKLSPQELLCLHYKPLSCSNNTNKLSPQELPQAPAITSSVQIIQINLALKNVVF